MKLAYFINVDWYFCLHWLDRAKAAQASGHEIHVLTRFTQTKYKELLNNHGFICHDISLDRRSMNPISLVKTYVAARAIFAELQPNIIHCITVKPNLIGGLIAKRIGTPAVLSVTGTGLAFSSKAVKARLSRRIIVGLYRCVFSEDTQRLVFENSDDSQLFQKLNIGSHKTHAVVPGAGVNSNEFAFSLPPTTGATLTVLFAARMLWDKGIQDLITACQTLRGKGYDIELKVAGLIDEDTQTAIPEGQIQEWHSNGVINWLGSIEDMPKLISCVDLVVLPTYYGEGIPRILIEAAACGRPCITTNVSGCREIVLDGLTGYLVNPHDPIQIASRIQQFADDRTLISKMGREARKLVESKYEQSFVIKRILDIYRELLSQS